MEQWWCWFLPCGLFALKAPKTESALLTGCFSVCCVTDGMCYILACALCESFVSSCIEPCSLCHPVSLRKKNFFRCDLIVTVPLLFLPLTYLLLLLLHLLLLPPTLSSLLPFPPPIRSSSPARARTCAATLGAAAVSGTTTMRRTVQPLRHRQQRRRRGGRRRRRGRSWPSVRG